MNYWEECIAIACDEAGVTVTDRQVQVLASSVEAAHENHGMAFGHDAIPPPHKSELDAVKNELALECSKVPCAFCGGVDLDVNTSRVRGDVEFLSLMDKACKRRPISPYRKQKDGIHPEDFANVLADLVKAHANDPVVKQWQAMTRQFIGDRSLWGSLQDWNILDEPQASVLHAPTDREDGQA